MVKNSNQFSEQVFSLVSQIPKGKVASYSDIAHALGTKAYRAVAQVLKTNPTPIKIPCHRIINSSGKLGGYFGNSQESLMYKKELLLQEGVQFTSKGLVPKEYFYQFK